MRKFKNSGFRILDFGFKIPHSAFRTPCTRVATRNRWAQAPHSKGFTLIELIITIVIVGIISGMAALILMQGVKAYTDEQSRADVHYQVRSAMERMAREIRTARSTSEIGTTVLGTITGNPTNSFIFVDVSGTNITYSLSGTTLNRTVGGVPSALAQGVTTLQFQHYTSAGVLTTVPASVWLIEINLTDTQGTQTLQMLTRVHPRNF